MFWPDVTPAPPTLIGVVTRRIDFTIAVQVGAVLLVAAATAAAAQVSVHLPFTPVPFTLQPMFVLVSGAALGARLGMLSQLVYLAAGAAGVPVFAASPILPQGFARLLGPTGGYLLCYPLAAAVTGWLAERGFDRRYLTNVVAMLAGLVVIFAGGVIWLAWFQPAAVGFEQALRLGFLPFVVADLLKVALAATLLPAIWHVVGPPR